MKMSVWSLACQKAYFSDITLKNMSKIFTHNKAAKASCIEITSLSLYVLKIIGWNLTAVTS